MTEITEEAFQSQEQRRQEVERCKEAVQKGAPAPESLDEFLVLFKKQLAENPLLREFLKREHGEMKAILEAVRRLYDRLLEENNVGLQANLSDLTAAIQKHDDNFNLYANQMLQLEKEKNQRIMRTLDVLDAELKI